MSGTYTYDLIDNMLGDTQAIRAYFFKLGLSSEIAEIYLALHAHGPQSISELSRNSGVERTRLYRLLDELKASNLVEIEMQYKKRIIAPAPINNMQILIAKREQELQELRAGLPALQEILGQTFRSEVTKIQAYNGPEGIRQMFWNQTRAKTESMSILYENMQLRTGLSFFERWAQTCNKRNMKFRSVISDNFIQTQQDWYSKHSNERLKDWQGRYVPDGLFAISHSTVIYDDVTSYYNWKNGEIFGMEIHNQEIADAQRLFFEMLWQQGLPVDDLKGPPSLSCD